MPEEIVTGIDEEGEGSGEPGSLDINLEDDDQQPLDEGEDLRKELDNLNKLYGKHTDEVGSLRTQNDQLRAEIDLLRTSYAPQQPYGYQPTQPGYAPQVPTNPWDDLGVQQQLTRDQAVTLANEVFNQRIQAIMVQNSMIASFFRLNSDLDPNKTIPILESVIRIVDPNQVLSPVDRMKATGQHIRDNYSSCVIRGGAQQAPGLAPAAPPVAPKVGSPPGGQTKTVIRKKSSEPKVVTKEDWVQAEDQRRKGKKTRG